MSAGDSKFVSGLFLSVALVLVSWNQAARAADLPTAEPAPAATPTPAPCASPQDVFFSDCPLTWNGITLCGTYDIGVGWVSHGMPVNGSNYEGESLVNRRFGVKETGALIPGHGGLLDRVDGLLFAVLAVAGARLVYESGWAR